MMNNMSIETMSRMTRPEEGQKGLGFGHRRGGMGRDCYRRPPGGSHLRNFPEGKRGASVTSKALAKQQLKSRVESMRDKGAQRAASWKLHIDDGCMGGGTEVRDEEKTSIEEIDGDNNDIYDIKWGNGWDKNNDKVLNPDEITQLSGNRFDVKRWGVFHYCLFANEAYHPSDKKTHLGIAEGSDPNSFYQDDLIIGDGDITKNIGTIVNIMGWPYFLVTGEWVAGCEGIKQAGVFMHELGHNLGLLHPTPKFKDSHSGIPGIQYLSDGFGPRDKHTCMNYWYILSMVEYMDSEWKSLSLPLYYATSGD